MTAAVILLAIANLLTVMWCAGSINMAYKMLGIMTDALKAQEELNGIQNELNEAQEKINHNVLEIINGRRREEKEKKAEASR